MANYRTHWERSLYLLLASLTALMAFVLLLVVQPLGANVSQNDAPLSRLVDGVCSVPGSHADIQAALDDFGCTSLDIGSGVFTGTFTTTHSINIQGQGAVDTVVDGNRRHPVFNVQDGHEVTVSSLTIRDGWYNYIGDVNPGGGILNTGMLTVTNCIFENNRAPGGGIYNDGGTVTIVDSQFKGNGGDAIWNVGGGFLHVETTLFSENTNYAIRSEEGLAVLESSVITGTSNRAIVNDADSHFVIDDSDITGNGGGVGNSGVMTITNSVIDGNSGDTYGAGIIMFAFSSEATLTISDTTISNNHATKSGGGIYATDVINIYNSTISGNSADEDGGGLYLSSPGLKTIVNSTISDNSAVGNGGGVYNDAFLEMLHTTVYSNSAVQGGALYNEPSHHPGITVDNSIIGGNTGGNCFYSSGVIDIDVFNLDTDGSCDAATEVDDLKLAPLADYGGATFTHKLLPASPAIDSADDNLCPLKDQRGEDRPYDGDGDGDANCDVGSFELQASDISPKHKLFLPAILK